MDASPPIKAKLVGAGDRRAGEILDVILRDEIGHVAVGNHCLQGHFVSLHFFTLNLGIPFFYNNILSRRERHQQDGKDYQNKLFRGLHVSYLV